MVDTATEVIDVCRDLRTEITLLKGISVSDRYYPEIHLRSMGDIDVLIREDAYQSVEEVLLGKGYLRDAEWLVGKGMHHGAPLWHPDRQVWVELHTALFPSDDRLCCKRTFSSESVTARSESMTFHGRLVNRLSDELQLVYSASSWMRDLMRSGPHPSFLNSLLDVVSLLATTGDGLDWQGLCGWLDNDNAKASLYVTLTYVSTRRIGHVPTEFVTQLGAGQRLVGALELMLMHAMLDRCLIGGKGWFRALPYPYIGRFSLREQLRKRLAASVDEN